jgi:hypothetical protein
MTATPAAKKVRVISTFVDGSARLKPRALFLLVLGGAVSSLVGCGGSGEKSDDTPKPATLRDEGKAVFQQGSPSWSTNASAPPPPGEIREIGSIFDTLPANTLGKSVPVKDSPNTKASGPVDASASKWTIVLAVFRGDDHEKDAAEALGRLKQTGVVPEAYLQHRGPSTLVAYGQYSGPSEDRARGDLERIQGMSQGGSPVFPGAYLCPPYQAQAASMMGQHDLRRARQELGASALYTLQVGWYGREDMPRTTEADLAESRKAAEAAVSKLRNEGELAFYYHGPNRSMVTIGAFGSDDFDPANRPGEESARLKETRRRHPLNLYNGAGYSYKASGMKESKLLPSGLVRIPTK